MQSKMWLPAEPIDLADLFKAKVDQGKDGDAVKAAECILEGERMRILQAEAHLQQLAQAEQRARVACAYQAEALLKMVGFDHHLPSTKLVLWRAIVFGWLTTWDEKEEKHFAHLVVCPTRRSVYHHRHETPPEEPEVKEALVGVVKTSPEAHFHKITRALKSLPLAYNSEVVKTLELYMGHAPRASMQVMATLLDAFEAGKPFSIDGSRLLLAHTEEYVRSVSLAYAVGETLMRHVPAPPVRDCDKQVWPMGQKEIALRWFPPALGGTVVPSVWKKFFREGCQPAFDRLKKESATPKGLKVLLWVRHTDDDGDLVSELRFELK